VSPAPAVRVNQKASGRVASGHPWIFASDVLDRGGAAPGDAVTVIDPRGRPIGTAHYSSASQICLRLLSPRIEAIDRPWFTRRLEAAFALRRRLVQDTDAFRLVYGEADGLPGLVVDRYADYLALQALDQGMDRATPDIVACLQELLAPAGIVARNDVPVRAKENLQLGSSVLAGEVPERVTVRMNGLQVFADLVHGQKTGVYLDQRENYLAAARYARGHALDCFTSAGGFALRMAARSESVEAADSSAAALVLAEANREANGITNVRFREADVFELLAGYAAAGRRFDTIVLDPPAFAKSRSALAAAVRGYKEINLRALKLLEPGGVLVTCSCSHHLSEAAFLEILAEASLDAARPLRILERRTQSQDHPILLTVPETHYLKCLILEAI
jgi:23S rRNA (cytosine1962-C5)-methyltransferase